ncbi:MAG: endonuclease/exonuclease/phosphatase family protein [Caldilineaceae bacterium]|nr:endonuclease/exonuclease/phosphatase family protein [Caldilineaceae bacterium]
MIRRLLDLLAGGIASWLLLWRLLGDLNGWLALANAWVFWILLIGMPAGVAAFVRRSRWLALGWLIGLSAFFWKNFHRHLGWRTPPPMAGAPTADRLTIFSANMLNIPRDLTDAVETIRRLDADILLFQEAIDSHVNQLRPGLAAAYPYACWVPYLPTDMGLGVASRCPFAVTGFWQNVGLEPYALRISLALPGGPLDIYCIHFISPNHEIRRLGPTLLLHIREQQILTILGEIAPRDRPALVAGDWNSTEGADSYRWTSAQLTDGWLEGGAGPGWTWPRTLKAEQPRSFVPLLRLDYLFHTGRTRGRAVTVESMQIITAPRIGSDHCPLLAHVAVAPQTQ